LGTECICDFLDRNDCVNARNLFFFWNSVKLDFVAHLCPQSDENNIGHESANENEPFNFKPDHDRAHAIREMVPVKRLWHNVHALSYLGHELYHQKHAHEGTESFNAIHVQTRVASNEIEYHHNGMNNRNPILASFIDLIYLGCGQGIFLKGA